VSNLRRIALIAALVAVVGVAAIAVCHANRTIRTEIVINRSPTAVWQVLTATGQYSAWNPMIDRIVGELREGNVIEVDEGMVFHPVILTVRPNKELRWKGYVGTPGLFDGDHRFILEPDGDATHVIQTETFSGILAGQLMRGIIDDTVEAMREMNRALKTRVESSADSH